MMCARRATVPVLADSPLKERPASARQIVRQRVAGLMVSVAVILGPSPLMAGTTTIWQSTTLTADHVGEIVIGADGVVLNCAGHKITNPGGAGITLNGRVSVTVTNCVVTNSLNGIALISSSGNTLVANTAEGNTAGFNLITSTGNLLNGNTARGNSQFGIRLERGSSSNKISNSTIANNALGLTIVSCLPNFVFNNKFLDNTVQAAVIGSPPWHFFDLAAPTGGNYWRDFDSLAEGCSDANPSDGFCDSPKVFAGGQDDLPSTTPYGSVTTTKAIEICHYPPGNPTAPRTIAIGEPAWPAHEAHGDKLGRCQ